MKVEKPASSILSGASGLSVGGLRLRLRRGFFFITTLAIVVVVWLLLWLYRDRFGGFFATTTILTLNQGSYIGEILSQSSKYPRAIQAFRGIPYAQSTAGENRFRPPQPLPQADDLETALSALYDGDYCPQNGGGWGQGEDCLNLNIYRPHYGDDLAASAAEKNLPVVVYVHGGGFNSGRGSERNMASFAAWSESPIIAVSFNYRVGAFGFLPGSVVAKEGLLNLGLKDQQFLFEWVRSNIADIGGNPDNVTIMGLSAGAHSIGHQLISYAPVNKIVSDPPPFRQAILESGGSLARAVFVPDHPLHEQQFQDFLSECDIDKSIPDDEIIPKLRDQPLYVIARASGVIWKRWESTLRWPFQPVIDGPGGVIPDLPISSWAKGNILRIPIMTGFNTNEGANFVPPRASNSSAMQNLMSTIIPALNETDLAALETMYPDPRDPKGKNLYIDKPPAGFGTQFWRLDDVYAHYAYICPVLQVAHLASHANDGAPVFAYQFAARSNAHGAADHSDETPVVTHDMSVIGNFPGLVSASDAMVKSWTRFVATGDPNPTPSGKDERGFSWPKFVSPFNMDGTPANNEASGKIALFGEHNDERMYTRGRQNRGVPAQIKSLTDREREECQFWWERVILSQGFGNGSLAITKRDERPLKAKL